MYLYKLFHRMLKPRGRTSCSNGSSSLNADLIDISLISKIFAISKNRFYFFLCSGDFFRISSTATALIVIGFLPVRISDFTIFSAVVLHNIYKFSERFSCFETVSINFVQLELNIAPHSTKCLIFL